MANSIQFNSPFCLYPNHPSFGSICMMNSCQCCISTYTCQGRGFHSYSILPAGFYRIVSYRTEERGRERAKSPTHSLTHSWSISQHIHIHTYIWRDEEQAKIQQMCTHQDRNSIFSIFHFFFVFHLFSAFIFCLPPPSTSSYQNRRGRRG